MSLGAAIYSRLTAVSGLANLVGNSVFPLNAPQGQALPYIVWQKIDSEPIETHIEQNSEADSFNRVQFTVFASDYDRLSEICAELIEALDGFAVLDNHPASFDSDRDIPSDLPGVHARAIDFIL